MKTRYLVCYDYGQGGVWAFVSAPSEAAILRKYPELQISKGREEWMTDEWLSQVAPTRSYDLDDEPKGVLEAVLIDRQRPAPR